MNTFNHSDLFKINHLYSKYNIPKEAYVSVNDLVCFLENGNIPTFYLNKKNNKNYFIKKMNDNILDEKSKDGVFKSYSPKFGFRKTKVFCLNDYRTDKCLDQKIQILEKRFDRKKLFILLKKF